MDIGDEEVPVMELLELKVQVLQNLFQFGAGRILLNQCPATEKEDINSRSRASYICSLYSDVWRD